MTDQGRVQWRVRCTEGGHGRGDVAGPYDDQTEAERVHAEGCSDPTHTLVVEQATWTLAAPASPSSVQASE